MTLFNIFRDTIVPWLNFFLSTVKEQATNALALVEQEHEEGLSPKQSEVLQFFASVSEASPAKIASATGMVTITVRKSLERLLELGKVKRIGRGRGTRYVKI